MTTKFYRVKIESEKDSPEIHPYSDMHYGSISHDNKSFKLYKNTTEKDKDSYVLGLGDWIEGATKESIGFEDQNVNIMDQIDYITKEFKKIADENRLIGLIRGNHENRARKAAQIDITQFMAEKLGVKYFGRGAFLRINVKKPNHNSGRQYTLYAIHGNSMAQTIGGKINAIRNLGEMFEGIDVMCMGHVHYANIDKGFRYYPVGEYIRTRRPLYVLTGHYLEFFDSYAQEKGYKPSGPAGTPKIKFHIDMKRVSGSL